ncbi:MAG: acetyl-coenzyme A synthetase N-terminal domain-containing protein [Aestuariivirgaceae bacterium]
MNEYERSYARWKANPEAFWAQAAQEIDWIRPWRKTFERVEGLDRWFVGAECNTCDNCIDRHVREGRGGQKALIYDSPVAGIKTSYSYRQLLDEVATLGAVLAAL